MTRWRGFALGPDGRSLVWPAADGTIQLPDLDHPGESHEGSRLRLFDLMKGVMVDRFAGFEGSADDLFFGADGKTLVTVDHNRRCAGVRVWDLATGRVERYFPAFGEPGSRVRRSRLSPDGKSLAVAYDGADRGLVPWRSAKLWDLATGEELPDAPGRWFDDAITAFAPGGRTVATAGFDGTIQVRDAATWRATGEFRGLGDRPTALGFGPDGRLFSGVRDGTILAWDPRAARPPAAPR